MAGKVENCNSKKSGKMNGSLILKKGKYNIVETADKTAIIHILLINNLFFILPPLIKPHHTTWLIGRKIDNLCL